MKKQSYSNEYTMGLDLAEASKHTEALDCIQKHLQTSPDDAEALNDTGAILHCLNRSDEAIEYFIKAKNLMPDSAEILWNLCECFIADGKAKQAMDLFDDMQRLEILNADVLNRTATLFLNRQDKANAVETLLRSLQVWSDQEILRPTLEVIRSQRPKIAFFCGADGTTFLNEITEFIKQRFQVRVFEGTSEDELFELMKWSDISWFEWCTNLASIGSRFPKVCKNIIRLHRYEAYEQWPQQVNWDNIDILITVGNKATTQTLLRKVPYLENRTFLITVPNGINLDKFIYTERQRGKNIAFLANIRMIKNPAFVLQCMQKLHYIDKDYRLFFAGSFQDQALEQYLRHMVEALDLSDVVFFEGWQHDVVTWLQDKQYIVSTSICEGVPVGILQAMACGIKPVIHNFLGAEYVFPSEFLFNISEEFCEQILSDTYEPRKYRKFVEEKYSLQSQLNKVNDIFTQLETEIELENQSINIDSGFSPMTNAQTLENDVVFR